MTKTGPARIVVVGGGYAGTLAANHLHQRDDIEVTLINPRPMFVERIRLHQLAAGSGDAQQDYHSILNPRIRLIVDEATEIDPAGRRVRLASSGEAYGYDYLIYAVGSTAAMPAVSGGEFAFPVSDYEHAGRLRTRLAELGSDEPVCVVGGGLTGIETAAELARAHRSVTLICETLGATLHPRACRSLTHRLGRLGVTVWENTSVTAVGERSVVVSDGRVLPSAVTVWTAGFEIPRLAARSGLRTDPTGRILTDETLTSISNPWIVAAGDAVSPSGRPLRMSCQAALPLGAKAAATVLDRIAGQTPHDVNQAFLAQCLSLGRSGGLIQFTHTDDTPRRLYVAGRLAATIKETICAGTIKTIARTRRRPGSYFWPHSRTHRPPPMTSLVDN